MSAKEKLYRLVEELPEGEILPAERFLEYLRNRANDPVLQAFMDAPMDDEPLTEEELQAIQAAEKELSLGEVSTWEQVRLRTKKSS